MIPPLGDIPNAGSIVEEMEIFKHAEDGDFVTKPTD